MNMTGEVIIPRLYLIHRMMCEDKVVQQEFIVNPDTFALILKLAHDIVVPQHKLERHGSKMSHQFAEYLPLRVVKTVEKIPEEQNASRFNELG
jgi:hypothetical protein